MKDNEKLQKYVIIGIVCASILIIILTANFIKQNIDDGKEQIGYTDTKDYLDDTESASSKMGKTANEAENELKTSALTGNTSNTSNTNGNLTNSHSGSGKSTNTTSENNSSNKNISTSSEKKSSEAKKQSSSAKSGTDGTSANTQTANGKNSSSGNSSSANDKKNSENLEKSTKNQNENTDKTSQDVKSQDKNKTSQNSIQNVSFKAPVSGNIIKNYARDSLVYSDTLKEWITHNGVDIKADKTSVVASAADGTVYAIKNDPRYGLTIIINHDNGYQTIYSNLLTTEFVVEGEKVSAGQSIGTVGNSSSFEYLDDYHLHFEVLKDGEYLDPTLVVKF